MREQPTGEVLLQAARDALKNKVLPLLQGEGAADAKREVLMAMNALSIAQRELQMGNAPDVEESVSLAGLVACLQIEPASASALNMAQANRDLASRIRQGGADPGTPAHTAVLAHLRAVGRSRLQASNPKVLKAGQP